MEPSCSQTPCPGVGHKSDLTYVDLPRGSRGSAKPAALLMEELNINTWAEKFMQGIADCKGTVQGKVLLRLPIAPQ